MADFEYSDKTFIRINKALAADYFSIYYVNLDTDEFVEYSSDDRYDSLGLEKRGSDFFNVSKKNILRVIYPDDISLLIREFTKENILNELKDNPTFTLKYRLMVDNVPTYVSMKATKVDSEEGHFIVIGVNSSSLSYISLNIEKCLESAPIFVFNLFSLNKPVNKEFVYCKDLILGFLKYSKYNSNIISNIISIKSLPFPISIGNKIFVYIILQ